MLRYTVSRLIQAVFLLWAVTTFTFFLIHSAPGLPTIESTRSRVRLTAIGVIAELGLDQPLSMQMRAGYPTACVAILALR